MAKAVSVSIFGTKAIERKFKSLAHGGQKRVLTRAMNQTAKKAVKPILQRQMPSRSFDPPLWPSEVGGAMVAQSHTGAPGVMKNKMKVKAGKRSRTSISQLVMLPTRDKLGIPDDYDFYYPAAIEYGVKFNKLTKKPQPAKRYMRTVFSQHRGPIVARLNSEGRKAMTREAARMKRMK